MTKKKVVRNFRRENVHFLRKMCHTGPRKKISSPPNSAPGLRPWLQTQWRYIWWCNRRTM